MPESIRQRVARAIFEERLSHDFGISTPRAAVEALDTAARRVVGPILCRSFGHQWAEETYAGPDSGETSVLCRRCGEEHTTILY